MASLSADSIRPPIRLIHGPAGAGKTYAAIRELTDRLSSSLLVVTTRTQAEWAAARACEWDSSFGSAGNGRIVPWSGLVAAILGTDTGARTTPIGRTFQRLILTNLIPETLRPDDFLGKMLHAPGFVDALQERIREWKLSAAGPDAFRLAADRALEDGQVSLAAKLSDIYRLFEAYERFLRTNGLRDEEDALVHAAEIVRNNHKALPFEASNLIVDGFYRFTIAQRGLLAAVASSGAPAGPGIRVTVTLPWEADRPLLFAASARTLDQFRREFSAEEITLAAGPAGERGASEPISRLRSSLFARSTAVASHLATTPAANPIRIVDAPNPYVEAEMIAREFLRIRADGSRPWSRFGIILRSAADYGPILSSVFERYTIPIAAEAAESCAANPLVRTILSLLRVVRGGWEREDVLAFLRSTYTLPDPMSVDRLRKQAWADAVREGRAEWLALGTRDAASFPGDGALLETLASMARFDDLLNEKRADVAHFVTHVERIIEAFGLEDRISLGEPARIDRDRSALAQARATLQSLARLSSIRGGGVIDLAEFLAALEEAWAHCDSSAASSADQVQVMEPHASRERPLEICAVMGLTERVFPRRITEDAFLRDEERTQVRGWVGVDLEEQRLRADDERLLFYFAATAPTERLLLSFPRAARENDALPSFFLDEVRDALGGASSSGEETPAGDPAPAPFETIVRTLADVAPRVGEAVTADDEILAYCADLFDPQAGAAPAVESARSGAAGLARLLNSSSASSAVRQVLTSRNRPPLPGLVDPELQQRFIRNKNVYTAAELETYGRCPFQYLLRHVWGIHADIEGLDGVRQSALLHSVLRRYFRSRPRGAESAGSSDAAALAAQLQAALRAALASAKLNVSPHQLQILRRRLDDDLAGFAQREVRFSERFGTSPAHFHVSFGRAAVGVSPDPLSRAEPLVLTGPDGEGSVALSGFIDRVDLDENGTRGFIVEYEVGKPPEFAAVLRGESLQLPIGLMALERLFGISAAAAMYDSMQEAGRRRFHRAEHVNVQKFGPMLPFDDASNVKPLSREQYQDLVRVAEAAALRLAAAIGSGIVAATPGHHCNSCAYRDVCRTTVVDGHDGERAPK